MNERPHDMNKNNPIMKITRLFVYLRPADKKREGACRRCGACCEFLMRCPFLRYNAAGLASCKIYRFRPWACIKYPLSEKHHETKEICGFWFRAE